MPEGGEVIGTRTRSCFGQGYAANPAEAVNLTLKLHFAVCHDICLPAKPHTEPGSSRNQPGPTRGPSPRPWRLCPPKRPMHRLRSGRVDRAAAASGGEPSLIVDLKGAAPGDPTDILVEGPPTAYFGAPQDAGATAEGAHRFRLPISVTGDVAALKGAPADAHHPCWRNAPCPDRDDPIGTARPIIINTRNVPWRSRSETAFRGDVRDTDGGRPAEGDEQGAVRRQEGCAVCGAGRLHAHLSSEAPAGLHRARERVQGQGRGHRGVRFVNDPSFWGLGRSRRARKAR